jgi:SAM-dependent methyltransferase
VNSLNQIAKWNDRYRQGHDDLFEPLPFVVDTVSPLAPGRALDISCGPGRHSVWLAERGWDVTAIDGSNVAIDLLRARGLPIRTSVADLEAPGFRLPGSEYDLVLDTFFLHRPLFEQIGGALRAGGIALFAFHLQGSFAINQPELDSLFPNWRRVHYVIHNEVPTAELVLKKP